MLGAGERRLVLLDFLLMVLREARTGSSDMCGYREVEGREGTVHRRGGNGEFTPIPRPASLPSTPDGGSSRQLQPLPSGGLPPVPGIASARTAAVFRPALAAHLPPPPSLLLPVAIPLQRGAGSWHPATPAAPAGTQRCLGRERGVCRSRAQPRRPCRNASGSPSRSLLQTLPTPHPGRCPVPGAGGNAPPLSDLGRGSPPWCPPLTCRWSP